MGGLDDAAFVTEPVLRKRDLFSVGRAGTMRDACPREIPCFPRETFAESHRR